MMPMAASLSSGLCISEILSDRRAQMDDGFKAGINPTLCTFSRCRYADTVGVVIGKDCQRLDAGHRRELGDGAGRAKRPYRPPSGAVDCEPGFEPLANAEPLL